MLALADLSTLVGLRDRAMMEVLYATGMRRMELAGLCTDDIDADRGLVLIRQGKGGKDRLVPLGQRALYWVQRYQEEVRPHLAWNHNERALFLGQEGYALGLAQLTGPHGGLHQGGQARQTRRLPPVAAQHGHANAGGRCRHPVHSSHARTQRHQQHADLHAGGGGDARQGACPDASGGVHLPERLQARQEQRSQAEKTPAPLPAPWPAPNNAPDGDFRRPA
ncbi:MAG: tyrosine-type recombinase/integrase [Rhizobacter sp.]